MFASPPLAASSSSSTAVWPEPITLSTESSGSAMQPLSRPSLPSSSSSSSSSASLPPLQPEGVFQAVLRRLIRQEENHQMQQSQQQQQQTQPEHKSRGASSTFSPQLQLRSGAATSAHVSSSSASSFSSGSGSGDGFFPTSAASPSSVVLPLAHRLVPSVMQQSPDAAMHRLALTPPTSAPFFPHFGASPSSPLQPVVALMPNLPVHPQLLHQQALSFSSFSNSASPTLSSAVTWPSSSLVAAGAAPLSPPPPPAPPSLPPPPSDGAPDAPLPQRRRRGKRQRSAAAITTRDDKKEAADSEPSEETGAGGGETKVDVKDSKERRVDVLLPRSAVSAAMSAMQTPLRVYAKLNDLCCCRHECGCLQSKFDGSKKVPDTVKALLRQAQVDKWTAAEMKDSAHCSSKEQALEKIKVRVEALERCAIIRRASRAQHEQNATLHRCGQQAEDEHGRAFPCRQRLRAIKTEERKQQHLNSAAAGDDSLRSVCSAVDDEDALLRLLFTAETANALLAAAASAASSSSSLLAAAPAGSTRLRLPSLTALQRFHARGLCLPLLHLLPVSGSESTVASLASAGASGVRCLQLPLAASCPRSEGGRKGGISSSATGGFVLEAISGWLHNDGLHTTRSIAPLQSDTPPVGSCCSAGQASPSASAAPVGMSSFLHCLAVGKRLVCFTTIGLSTAQLSSLASFLSLSSSSSSLSAVQQQQQQQLAFPSLELRLLSAAASELSLLSLPSVSESDDEKQAAPGWSSVCSLLSPSAFRCLSVPPLFASCVTRVLSGSLSWLVVQSQHRQAALEVAQQAAWRQLQQELGAAGGDAAAEGVQLSDLLFLLYSGQLMLDPLLFLVNGIPVSVCEQSPSQLLLQDSAALLWAAVTGSSACMTVDTPLIPPVSWLRSGPEACLALLKSASEATARLAQRPSASSPYSARISAAITATVSRMFPQPQTVALFRSIKSELEAADGGSRTAGLSSLTAAERRTAQQLLAACIVELNALQGE